MASPAQRPWSWPPWLFVLVVASSIAGIAGWAVVYLRYGNKIPSAYFFYFFLLGPGLLLVLAIMGFVALALALSHAFRRQWRRKAWLLLCALSSGGCALGFFPVVLAVASGIADDGHQNE